MKISACGRSVYALFLGLFICAQGGAALGKEDKGGKSLTTTDVSVVENSRITQFQWAEHKKLSWEDFRGDVRAANEESAAATHCGIGFKTKSPKPGNKSEVVVYNTFYTDKSWVRPDAKIQSILTHEQGHFDLCEIYTRKLKVRMEQFDFNAPDVRKALMGIYTEISNEYETRQQAYERETTHGTNLGQQKRWTDMIAAELM